MNKLVKEELDAMKYLLGYQRGKVISEQAQVTSAAPAAAPAAAPQTVEDVVKKIQEILNTKYGAKLTVDGKWGNLTQTAFESAVKTKSAAPKAAPTPIVHFKVGYLLYLPAFKIIDVATIVAETIKIAARPAKKTKACGPNTAEPKVRAPIAKAPSETATPRAHFKEG